MKKIVSNHSILFMMVLAVCLLTHTGFAQKETFDIATYTRPKGWVKEVKPGYRAFSITNKAKNTFCKIIVYKSLPSSGSSEADFELLWQNLVAETYKIAEPPQKTEPVKEEVWEILGGGGQFVFNKKPAMALLTTLSGNNKTMGIVALTNHDSYLADVEKFMTSVSLPAAKKDVVTNPPVKEPKVEPTPPLSSSASNASGIVISTVNFDDGWTNLPEAEWVKVTKGPITVLLHYGQDFDDAMRMNPVEVCWNKLAAGRYQVAQRHYYNYSALNFPFYYTEAEVTEKSSGKKMYVGFRVIPVNGVAYCVEVQAPDKTSYVKHFPTVEGLETMRYYNRFAIHPDDITGTWNSFASASIQLYNVYTGGHAGLNYSAMNDEFTFQKNGTYSSKHVGAGSSYGSASYYKDQYNGKHTVSHWDLTLSNRKDGRTEAYHAHYEAVKGGRILHLTHKQYSGINYRLVKMK
jgi:hypothetical protein